MTPTPTGMPVLDAPRGYLTRSGAERTALPDLLALPAETLQEVQADLAVR